MIYDPQNYNNTKKALRTIHQMNYLASNNYNANLEKLNTKKLMQNVFNLSQNTMYLWM
jgi:hypothetical protein